MRELKPYREPLLQPRTFRRLLVALGLAIAAYGATVLFLVIYPGEKVGRAGLSFIAAMTRQLPFFADRAPPQPTCDGCVALAPGSRVVLGSDTVALLWEMRSASRPPELAGADLLIRGAFVPGGAQRTPSDSGTVALVPQTRITTQGTVVLQIIPRDAALGQGLQPRGRLFTDGPDMRAYTIFW